MSAWLVELIGGLGEKLVSGFFAWWERRRFEQEAKRAEELAERLVEIEQEAERQQALRDAMREKIVFTYPNWEDAR